MVVCAHGSMPIEVCPWFYAHGGVLQTSPMVVCPWFYAHGGVLMVLCSRHLPGGVLMVMRSRFYAHGSISIEVLPWWCAAPH